MKQFDVCYRRASPHLFLLCQTDMLQHLDTRFVAPLFARDESVPITDRLNPAFMIDSKEMVLFPQFALSVRKSELGDFVISLDHEHFRIMNALDMLLGGV